MQALIYDECIATLCALGNQMGPRFITFDSLISRSIEGKNIIPFNTNLCIHRMGSLIKIMFDESFVVLFTV